MSTPSVPRWLHAPFAALLLAAGTAQAAAPAEPASSPVADLAPASDGVREGPRAARGSRLRFRGDGPTCMCADGLSERDIRAVRPRTPDSPTQSTPP